MRAIEKCFRQLDTKKEGALIGYIMAGDPSINMTPKFAKALIEGGIDILELGIPFFRLGCRWSNDTGGRSKILKVRNDNYQSTKCGS